MKHYNESANAFIYTRWDDVGDTSTLSQGDPVEQKKITKQIEILTQDHKGRYLRVYLHRHELLDLMEHMKKIEEETRTGKFYPLPF